MCARSEFILSSSVMCVCVVGGEIAHNSRREFE